MAQLSFSSRFQTDWLVANKRFQDGFYNRIQPVSPADVTILGLRESCVQTCPPTQNFVLTVEFLGIPCEFGITLQTFFC